MQFRIALQFYCGGDIRHVTGKMQESPAGSVGVFDEDRRRLLDVIPRRSVIAASTSAQRGLGKIFVPYAAIPRFPNGIAGERRQAFHTALAALSAFHQTLQRFHRVEIVNVEVRIEADDRFLDSRAEREFPLRASPSHG